MGVERFDQGDFLRSAPLFDFFFARDGGANVGVGFEPDKLGDVVSLREAGDGFFFVLADAVGKVTGHAEVEYA